MKRHVPLLLSAILLVCFLFIPKEVWAAGEPIQGYCGAEGDNLTWILDDSGKLTIFGTGAMEDYGTYTGVGSPTTPWFSYAKQITSVVIKDGVTSIGDYAFYWCGLKSVTIPNSVTSIGDYAFSGCRLSRVTIPDSVAAIGNHAFEKNNITSITIPNSVTSIGDYAFFESDLVAVTIDDSAATIGNYAFANCIDLSEVKLGEFITGIGEYAFDYCFQYLTAISIPGSVTSIGDYAFHKCYKLSEITIANGVENIGKYAFKYCKNVTEIIVPDSVQFIGVGAFQYCNRIASITVPFVGTSRDAGLGLGVFGAIFGFQSDFHEGLTRQNFDFSQSGYYYIPESIETVTITDDRDIHYGAFSNCSRIKSITLPSNVASISKEAFNGCTGLTNIYILDAQAWCSVKFSDRTSNPANYAEFMHLRDGRGNEVTTLILSDVIEIPENAFRNCKNLTSIVVSGDIQYIGEGAFSGCAKLESVTIPFVGASSDTNEGAYEYPFGYIFGKNSFDGGLATQQAYYLEITNSSIPAIYYIPSSLKQVVITGGAIYKLAFVNCSTLINIVLPNGATIIGEYAFSGCKSLACVTIPASITKIGEAAFNDCNSLWHVLHKGTERQWNQITIDSENSLLETVTKHHTYSDNLEIDVMNKFCAICQTTCIHIWDDGDVIKAPSCDEDGKTIYTCSLCYATQQQTVAATGHKDGDKDHLCDYGCGKKVSDHSYTLTVTNPTCSEKGYTTNVCVVCGHSFIDMYKDALGHSFGDWYTAANGQERRDCSRCSHYEIRAAATKALIRIEITQQPNKLTYLQGEAFDQTGMVVTAYYSNGLSSVVTDYTVSGYTSTPGKKTITVTYNKKTAYFEVNVTVSDQNAIATGTCGNNLVWSLNKDGVLSILGSGAMFDYSSNAAPWRDWCSSIKSVAIEEGVTSIGAYAFKDYTNIANIMLPNSLINIGRCAFWGCKSLTILVIPDKVTDLGQCAFRNCTSLTNVTLGNSISSISDQAFQECSGLKSVTIPTSVANIGYCAFDDCSSLEEVIYQGTVSDKERIQIDAYNDCLANAAWRCGTCVGQHTYSNDCDSNCNVCGYVRETSHNYGNWKVVTKATCTTDGLERQDCVDCGDYYTRVIKATGHDWDGGKITKQPSCAAEGVKTYSCSGCGGTKTEVIAKTADHKYGSWTKVNDSTHKHSCSVCQKEETASHSWDAGKVTKQPTCKETGIKTFACVVCNATRTELIDKLTTHTYGNWTSVGGSTHKHTCTVCGKEETESHGWDGGVVTEQPTEKTEGQRRFTCQHCGATKTETIPKLDHVHNYNTVVTIPTCTAQGYTTHTCACGDSYEDTYMNALGHKDANKDHVCDNGCDISQGAHADGDDADHKCDYGCGMDNMTGHNYAKKVTTPTCLDKGFTTYTCACGDTYIADEVPANGHAEVIDAAIAASCTQSGLTEGKHCSICGAVTIKQQTVNKVPHDEIVLSGYPATHSAAGLTDGKKCSVCGKITMEQAVIPALQHTIQVIPGYPATCTEPGLTDGQKCIGCCSGAMIVEQTVIPATGHEEEVIRGTDATCTEPGLSEGFVCKTCGAELKKQEEIPVIAHAFGHWQITEEATADKNGYKTRKCDVCGHAEVEVIPATGAPETEPTQPSETTPTTPTEQPSVQPTEPTQKETEPPVNDVAGSNDDKTSVVWVVAIVAAVCLAGGLAGGLILRRKRCV